MEHINVGAMCKGRRLPTKKALKEAMAADPSSVEFDGTAMMGPQFFGTFKELREDQQLTVVGPDPYRDRRWYANVKVVAGKVRVS